MRPTVLPVTRGTASAHGPPTLPNASRANRCQDEELMQTRLHQDINTAHIYTSLHLFLVSSFPHKAPHTPLYTLPALSSAFAVTASPRLSALWNWATGSCTYYKQRREVTDEFKKKKRTRHGSKKDKKASPP